MLRKLGRFWMLIFTVFFILKSPAILFAEDDAIPMPGDDAMPLPGEETAPPEFVPESDNPFPFELRGYVENTVTAEYLKAKKREILLHANRMRLNLSGKPDACVDFGIGVVGTLYRGATQVGMAYYLPEDVQQQLIPPDTAQGLPGPESLFRYVMEDDLYLQEAFGTLYMPHVRLRIGRHKFYTGTGYAFNPIDLFNQKNPLDPSYEVDGIDAVLVALELSGQTEIQGLARFGDRLNQTDYLARLKTYLRGWDVALQYTHCIKKRMDWEMLNTKEAISRLSQGIPFESFRRTFRWHLLAAEFAGEVWEVGIYGEGGYAFIEALDDPGTLKQATKNHERFLIGMDHTFDSELYVMAEYLRVGQGRTKSSEITLNDRLAYLNGEILSINRDVVFSGLSYPIAALVDLSLYAIAGYNDPSVLFNPWLNFRLYPGLNLSLTAYLPVGEEESQNGRSGPSGLVRLKFNF